jgi:hypothetical protein
MSGLKGHETGENYTMRSFIICPVNKLFLGVI